MQRKASNIPLAKWPILQQLLALKKILALHSQLSCEPPEFTLLRP